MLYHFKMNLHTYNCSIQSQFHPKFIWMAESTVNYCRARQLQIQQIDKHKITWSIPQIDLSTTWYGESTKIKMNQIKVNKNISQIEDLLVHLHSLCNIGYFIGQFYRSFSYKITTSSYQNESFYIQLFNWISSLQWNSLQLLSLLIAFFRPTMEEKTHLLKSFEGSYS